MNDYRLFQRFEETFRQGPYLHRNSQIGNRIADHLFDDLYEIYADSKLRTDVDSGLAVLNPKGVSPGLKARRGDGSFGPLVPGRTSVARIACPVPAGPTATVKIGAEVKILAKAMIKQIDRVTSDLCGQARHFRTKSPHAITVGLVGINLADHYVSFEGSRRYPTGEFGPHPSQEAPEAERRLWAEAEPCYDEFLVLPFVATNEPPFDFRWWDLNTTVDRYSSMLVRVLDRYGHQ
jgi:hypothetical protein